MKEKILSSLGAYYKKHKQNNSNTSLQHCLDVTETMLKKAKYGFLITQSDTGWCNSRLVQTFADKESDLPFSLWFGTGSNLRKTDEIWSNPKVTLSFESKNEDASLVIYGQAEIETNPDIKKRYWKSLLQLFFPKGPLSDEYVVVKIKPQRIEIINFKQNIIPEPFGLKSAVLVNQQNQWQLG